MAGSFIPVTIKCGEVSGSVTAKQLPDTGVVSVGWIQAVKSNAGNVTLGGPGVTIPNGVTDETSGIQLSQGEKFPITTPVNLNQFYIICDNAGDDIVYLVQQ